MPRHRAMTLTDAVKLYCEDCRVQGYKPSTLTGYQRTLRCFVRWAASEVEQPVTLVARFSAEAVKRYIAHLQQQPKWAENAYVPTQAARVSPTTVRNYVRDLKAFAAWLAREEHTPENVLTRVRKPKADEVPIAPFSQEELDAPFAALDVTDTLEFRDFVLLHALWDTGMRVGEWWPSPSTTSTCGPARSASPTRSGASGATSAFGKQTQKYLTRYLAMCRPEPALADDRHFFLSVEGYPLTTGVVEHVCTRLARRVGFRVHPHRFRHTFAVGMLRNGTDIRTLQKQMGHASVQILLRYLNLANEEAIETHRVNSPADKHHALRQAGARCLPRRRGSHGVV